jgi:molybdopterin molybdotransferase
MPPPTPTAAILSFEDARRTIEEHAARLKSTLPEVIDLQQAGGRVLAESITADRDFPPFPRSARDGYAVLAADLKNLPANLAIVGEIKAGDPPEVFPGPLRPGQAIGIMTGAAVPPGADAVVMVEYTLRKGNSVEIQKAVACGENVVAKGSEAKAAQVLLEPGARLSAAAISIAASVGKEKLQVFKRPTVAVLATGDEVINIAAEPGPHQIRNSNSYSLAAQVRAVGGQPVILPIAPDEPVRLRHLIEQGLGSDLLLLSGGVSMGHYDFVEQVLSDLRAEFFFTGARIQPGKPVVFGRIPDAAKPNGDKAPTYFLGLPGNPVSTMVTFLLFAKPLIEAHSGARPDKLRFLKAKLKSDVRTKLGLTRFLPAKLSGEFDQAEVELVRWQGSGDIAATARANCYLVVGPEREQFPAGELMPILLAG